MDDHISIESPEYLLGKLARGGQIYHHEVIRVAECNEDIWSGDLRNLLLMALTGQLKKKPGPKSRFSDWEWRCIFAAVDFRAQDIKEEREDPSWNRCAGNFFGPMEQAYEEVARTRKLGSGKSLANIRSSLNLC